MQTNVAFVIFYSAPATRDASYKTSNTGSAKRGVPVCMPLFACFCRGPRPVVRFQDALLSALYRMYVCEYLSKALLRLNMILLNSGEWFIAGLIGVGQV